MKPTKDKGPCPTHKQVKLLFNTSELLYDIKNYAYIEGNIMSDDERKYQLIDIAEYGNDDRVTRVLNLAYAECVEMLYPYTKEEICTQEKDSNLELLDCYVINTNLPIGFSQTTVNILSSLIHEYMVCRVVADWLSINKAESQNNWELKLLDIKNKIRGAVLNRRGPIKRKMQPF
ncbi:MAG: hypothetical protein E7083_05675 [Bacteroidales bacterium]|nr:hypothetical protein [Bacteroidales bacterium]